MEKGWNQPLRLNSKKNIHHAKIRARNYLVSKVTLNKNNYDEKNNRSLIAEMGHRSYVLHSHVRNCFTLQPYLVTSNSLFLGQSLSEMVRFMRPLFLHLTNIKKFCSTTAHPIFEMVMTNKWIFRVVGNKFFSGLEQDLPVEGLVAHSWFHIFRTRPLEHRLTELKGNFRILANRLLKISKI